MHYQTIPHGTHVMGYFHLIQHESFFFFSSHFQNNSLSLQAYKKYKIAMEPKLGDIMKVNPFLTGLTDWIEGQVIDVEHNPFMGLVISIKDNVGRIFFGQSKYFKLA